MQFSKVHCLFERSGTFKKAFQEMGYDAKDYDIVETNNVKKLYLRYLKERKEK